MLKKFDSDDIPRFCSCIAQYYVQLTGGNENGKNGNHFNHNIDLDTSPIDIKVYKGKKHAGEKQKSHHQQDDDF